MNVNVKARLMNGMQAAQLQAKTSGDAVKVQAVKAANLALFGVGFAYGFAKAFVQAVRS